MPQVWVTYKELGQLLDCDASAAREKSIECGWRRRVCGDGLTRVKLSPALAHEYMLSYALAARRDAGVDQPSPLSGMFFSGWTKASAS
jgi:hypothetical protein